MGLTFEKRVSVGSQTRGSFQQGCEVFGHSTVAYSNLSENFTPLFPTPVLFRPLRKGHMSSEMVIKDVYLVNSLMPVGRIGISVSVFQLNELL